LNNGILNTIEKREIKNHTISEELDDVEELEEVKQEPLSSKHGPTEKMSNYIMRNLDKFQEEYSRNNSQIVLGTEHNEEVIEISGIEKIPLAEKVSTLALDEKLVNEIQGR